MRCVGICYYEGVGVEQNIPNAWQWYKNAARQGDIEAQKFCDIHNYT